MRRALFTVVTLVALAACGEEAVPALVDAAVADTSDTDVSDIDLSDTEVSDTDASDTDGAVEDVAEVADIGDDADATAPPDVPGPDTADVGAPDVPDPPVEPTWHTLEALPVEVTENSAAALDGEIYVLGGFVGFEMPSDVYRYDPVADAWSEVAPLPEAGYHHASLVAAGGALYFVASHQGLGFAPSGDVYAYDPDADAWSTRASAPVARGAAGAAVIDGRIYVAGGVTPEGITGSLVVYDPGTDTWDVDLPPMAVPREHVAACALNGRLHVFGGRVGGLNNKADHEVFDPVEGVWTSAEPLPTARSGIAAAVLGERCHVFGGEQESGTFDEHEVWSDDDGWVTLTPMPTARHGLGAATVGGRIHVIGGGPQPAFTYSSAHEAWGP